MSILVYVKEGSPLPRFIGSWSTVDEACKQANDVLTSGAFDEVIISNKEHGKSCQATPHE